VSRLKAQKKNKNVIQNHGTSVESYIEDAMELKNLANRIATPRFVLSPMAFSVLVKGRSFVDMAMREEKNY